MPSGPGEPELAPFIEGFPAEMREGATSGATPINLQHFAAYLCNEHERTRGIIPESAV